IGSTAVPGLAAKDIIDIQVTVDTLDGALAPAFARVGYQRRADVTRDHRPPTATGPDDDWAKQYYQPATATRPVHAHVRRAGSPNGRYALLFRDYLRAAPLAAGAYAQVKRALAAAAPEDWDHYYDVKDPVCDIIMAGAETWAAATGWRPDHYPERM
ncbi:MAG TPA: GrpB family protein, partial [Ktedonobacterales bacterium]|nr:GrpB family protein [Ktedonobacterales bacterium]